ncbi:hypothetical protein DN752_10170 [Echinicola strongylocentroti]|uniref:Membrane metalloprotease n=1 Tax=Echinicola strongylocentroti TaxID=1795355 RepID=A0A2Z4II98_9BACT|nr:hypothetical protein [Echinicola strongylocentroti]AWW30459.1 hypothetical protein DN752_10170 [Echinicola strongylocentroti]
MHFIRVKEQRQPKYTWVFMLAMALMVTSCFKDSEVDERVQSIKAAKRAPGISAHEILSADTYKSIKLEVHYMEGYPLSSSTATTLMDWLGSLANKPMGIQLVTKAIPAMGQEKYSVQDVRDIEDENRTAYNTGDELGLYILVVDGYFEKDTETEASLGFAHRNTSLVLLGKRMVENSNRFGKPDKDRLETTVLEHELGHLLGLVNLGTAMTEDHEDHENSGHCDNEDCLMYWAVETNNIFNTLNQPIPTLDQNCLNDLKANGGK